MGKRLQSLLSAFIGHGAETLITLILKTCKIEVEGLDKFLSEAQKQGHVLALWHNRLLLVPHLVSRHLTEVSLSIVMSNSKDGDPMEVLSKHYPHTEAVRVAHDKKAQALKAIIRALRQKRNIVITPDGPKGPLYTIKEGMLFAAQSTQAQIFPLSWESTKYWELPTWDGLRIPRPFSTVRVEVGEGLTVPRDQEGKDRVLRELTERMHQPIQS